MLGDEPQGGREGAQGRHQVEVATLVLVEGGQGRVAAVRGAEDDLGAVVNTLQELKDLELKMYNLQIFSSFQPSSLLFFPIFKENNPSCLRAGGAAQPSHHGPETRGAVGGKVGEGEHRGQRLLLHQDLAHANVLRGQDVSPHPVILPNSQLAANKPVLLAGEQEARGSNSFWARLTGE